jgi:glycosyltransferase involved in cell wall biosynthesis
MPDLVHVHVPVKMGAGAIWLKRKFNIPFVVTEHSTVYIKDSFDHFETRSWYFRSSTKKIFEQADAVFSVSMYHRKLLEQLFSLKGKPYIIRNAVDVKMFYPLNEINKVKRFVHVSMMFPFKNIDGILNALALLNQTNCNWKVQFIGPATDEYKQLSATLGLDKQVEWCGTLPYPEVAKHMQKADALVHFSHYENLPCVINEALCCGIPVISSDVGGIAELINETNGILVEKNNTKQLAEALNNFLQNPDRFNKTNISSEASAIFNYSTIGKQILDLYKEVLGN